ncbi:condensation domain-containing protein [Actinomadura meridiana]|uniref:condensation domain-containing protein n=1 Tax=Actinomadura meridiana TaxID=559626 RepID=UPI0031F08AA9
MSKELANDETLFPLNASQRWLGDMLQEWPDIQTAIGASYKLEGSLRVEGLIRAIEAVVKRHDALRIRMPNDVPSVQRVLGTPSRAELVRCRQVKAESEKKFDDYIRAIYLKSLAEPFDLAVEYPFRFQLFRYGPESHALLCVFSHMAIDGRGRDLALKDLWDMFGTVDSLGERTAEGAGSEFEKAARAPSVQNPGVGGLGKVWQEPPVWRPRTELRGGGTETKSTGFKVHGEQLEHMRKASHQRDLTEFQWILAVFASLAFDLSNETRVAIAVPVDMRQRGERDVVGMFTSPMPIEICRSDSLLDLAKQAKKQLYSAVLLGQRNPDHAARRYRIPKRGGSEHLGSLKTGYLKLPPRPGKSEVDAVEIFRGYYDRPVDHECTGMELHAVSAESWLEITVLLGPAISNSNVADEIGPRFRARLQEASLIEKQSLLRQRITTAEPQTSAQFHGEHGR